MVSEFECPAGWMRIGPGGGLIYLVLPLMVLYGPHALAPLVWEVRERPLILRWN